MWARRTAARKVLERDGGWVDVLAEWWGCCERWVKWWVSSCVEIGVLMIQGRRFR